MTALVPRLGDPKRGPFVTALIPAYNNASTILPLLDSLAAQSTPADEVLVIDDGSTDATAALAEAHPIRPRVERLARNSGPSAARNAGVQATQDKAGSVILFLDSDVTLPPDVVAETKSVFCDPHIQAVNGIMVPPPLNPSPATWYKCLVEHSWGYSAEQWNSSATCLNTRIGAIRREAFLAVGGFDDSYRKPSVEDHEFGLRFTRNHSILLDRNLNARHHFSGFTRTVRNYWDRTTELLELLWSHPKAKTDKGGASKSSAWEFLLGAVLWACIALSPLFGHWLAVVVLLLFALTSWKSLHFCLSEKGWGFFAYCLLLHSVYGLVVTLAGATALLRRLLGQSRPARSAQ